VIAALILAALIEVAPPPIWADGPPEVFGQSHPSPGPGRAPIAAGHTDYTSIATWCVLQGGTDTTADNCGAASAMTEVGDSTPLTYTDHASGLRCVDLDGTNDYLTLANSAGHALTADTDFTIVFFAEPDVTGATMHGVVKSNTNAFTATFISDQTFRGTISSTNEFSDGTHPWGASLAFWAVRFVDATGRVEIYKNSVLACASGEAIGDCSADADGVSTTDTIAIGARPDGASKFNGELCDVAVFNNTALTTAQLCEICSFGVDGQDSDRNASLCGSCSLP
jgi:hypothetical protein